MLLKHNFLLFSIFLNQKQNGGPVLGAFLYYLGLCKYTLWRLHNDEIA
jgi:hypothetical protein